ncbi:signal peptidase II [Paenibacillus prosopidis]|uniref:Lipoprotein signal peptidase n=1 Tax=Paenibacillus prosopidis TaxID=630520 RepID=A0A368W1M6_9BACL|nr:signal peptidase II [Paenibacillus prosopidis]RCW46558.1 signal peptidase II [Paenibacillus prosopidis]
MRYYYYLIAVLVFVLDYVTKKIIATQLNIGEQISVIGNFFLITSHRNRGAAFGILQGQRLFFIIITIIILIGIIWYIQAVRKSAKPWLLVGLGLVLGGAVGNFLDRARFGEVVDFLQFNFGSYQFPIFNVADSAIVCGVALILIDTLLSAKDEKKRMQNGEDKDHNNHEQQPV